MQGYLAHPEYRRREDATGNIGRGIDLLRLLPADFAVYSGDDPTAMALMFCGGHGNISVTANVAPRAMHELCVAAMASAPRPSPSITRFPSAPEVVCRAQPGARQMGDGEMGLMPAGIRLPLVPLAENCHATVRDALRDTGILS